MSFSLQMVPGFFKSTNAWSSPANLSLACLAQLFLRFSPSS